MWIWLSTLNDQTIVRGLRALLGIGYQLSIPVTPEDFANPDNRENWKNQKGMIVLKLWSDIHRRIPIDVFIYEPFDFAHEHTLARWEKVMDEVQRSSRQI